MPLRACEIHLTDSVDMRLGAISDTMRENYMMLFIALIVLAFAAYMAYLFVSNIISTVRTHNRFAKAPDPYVTVNTTFDKSDDQFKAMLDDMNMGVRGDDLLPLPDTTPEVTSDDVKVKAKLQELKGAYADYNKQVTQHSKDHRKAPAEDVIDERLLSADDDVYKRMD